MFELFIFFSSLISREPHDNDDDDNYVYKKMLQNYDSGFK